MGIVQEKMGKIKEKVKLPSRSRTISVLCAAGLIICLFLIWLLGSNQGWIARNSFFKTFDINTQRIVTVYGANGELIRYFEGTYNVENFNNQYWVIMNQHTGERINIYGDSTIIIDESPDFNHKIEEE